LSQAVIQAVQAGSAGPRDIPGRLDANGENEKDCDAGKEDKKEFPEGGLDFFPGRIFRDKIPEGKIKNQKPSCSKPPELRGAQKGDCVPYPKHVHANICFLEIKNLEDS
jgi:hypothetical protein